MINVNDFRPGVTFEHEGNIYIVIESSHSKQGRGQASVKAKVKNLLTGSNIVLTFTGGDKVAKAMIEHRDMQYVYEDGASMMFMDMNNYEQIGIASSKLEWERKVLVEGVLAKMMVYQGEILGVELPPQLTLEVAETEPAVRGDTVTGATKKAILQTGLELQVPQFIEKGELVVIDSYTGKYISRSKAK